MTKMLLNCGAKKAGLRSFGGKAMTKTGRCFAATGILLRINSSNSLFYTLLVRIAFFAGGHSFFGKEKGGAVSQSPAPAYISGMDQTSNRADAAPPKSPLKTALVTGGGRRIGKAIVEDLARHGFAVAIHANTSLEEAGALADAINKAGGRACAVDADLSASASVSQLMAKASANLGPIGLLVNNASVFAKDSVEDFDEAVWDSHFAIHVKAPSILARDFASQLPTQNSGLIVNIIDQRVWSLNPRFYSYMLSKSALLTATKTMAQALAPSIRVVGIGPGPTLANDRQDPADFQAQVDTLLLKAGPSLDEFGATIRYLFETPSITGQMIALDGGQHLAWKTADIQEIVE